MHNQEMYVTFPILINCSVFKMTYALISIIENEFEPAEAIFSCIFSKINLILYITLADHSLAYLCQKVREAHEIPLELNFLRV